MITSFEVRPLPEARDFSEAAALLNDMVEVGLPLFKMECAGYGYEATQEHLNEILPAAGFEMSGAVTTIVRPASEDQSADLPLHLDAFPGIEARGLVDIIDTHYNLHGRTRDSFFVPTPGFMGNGGDLTETAHALFVAGAANDLILRPVCYQGEVGPDGLVLFRLFGKLPVVHHFQTLAWPRISNVQFASSVGRGAVRASSQ